MGISKSNKLKKKAWNAQQKHSKSIMQLLKECKSQKDQILEQQATFKKQQDINLHAEAKYYSRKIIDPDGKKETIVFADFVPCYPDGFVLESNISYGHY